MQSYGFYMTGSQELSKMTTLIVIIHGCFVHGPEILYVIHRKLCISSINNFYCLRCNKMTLYVVLHKIFT